VEKLQEELSFLVCMIRQYSQTCFTLRQQMINFTSTNYLVVVLKCTLASTFDEFAQSVAFLDIVNILTEYNNVAGAFRTNCRQWYMMM
jgi:hypothetical protein